MSQKLTKELRTAIIASLVAATFADRIAKLTEEKRALGDTLYATLVTPEEAATMKSLPSKFFGTRDHLYACIRTESDGYNRDYPSSFSLPLSDLRRMPYADAQHPYVDLPINTALGIEAARLVDLNRKIEEDTFELERKVEGLLLSCSTVRKLIATWPDIEPHIPEWAKSEKISLPAVRADEVVSLIEQVKKAA